MTTKANSLRKARSKPDLRVVASNEAFEQVKLIAGSEDAPITIRAIHSDKSAKKRAEELHGKLRDLLPEAHQLNDAGYNIYILAQVAGPIAPGRYVSNSDIIAARCIYVDGDESALPPSWHVRPTFTLEHPNGRWWAFWRTVGLPTEDAPNLILRAALKYGGDDKVHNLGRVVRLAGFDRWKDGRRSEPYKLHVRSGEATEPYWHLNLPPLPSRKPTTKDPNADDVIDEQRLRALLALIDPAERGVWITVGLVIRDGTVIDHDGRELTEADKLILFDEWSSGDLWRKAPEGQRLPKCYVGNYQGCDDCENALETPQASKTDLATFSSVVHLAKEHSQRQGVTFPAELGRPGKPERSFTTRQGFDPVAKIDAAPSADGDGIELYNGPEYANRPRGEWLVRNVCEVRKLSIASGSRGAGKSIGELALALSVATGKPWLDYEVAKRQVVIWIAAEGQGRIWSDVLALCDLMGIAPDALRDWFFIYPLHAHLNSDAGKKRLEKILQKVRKLRLEPGYVVFDTLSKNMVGNVSDDKDVSAALATALELNEAGIAVTLIAHFGKAENLGTRGSVQWEADADQVRYYRGKPKDGNTSIELEKVKLEGNDGTTISVRYEKRNLADGRVGHVILRNADAAAPINRAEGFQPKRANQYAPTDPRVLDLIDDAIADVLNCFPSKSWTTKHLAEMLVARPELEGFSSASLERRTLKQLRETKSRKAHRLYEPSTRQWKPKR